MRVPTIVETPVEPRLFMKMVDVPDPDDKKTERPTEEDQLHSAPVAQPVQREKVADRPAHSKPTPIRRKAA